MALESVTIVDHGGVTLGGKGSGSYGLAERLMAGLDEGLRSLSLPILVYMYNPCSDNK